ncbi:hypothetical protein BDW22DRAFT_801762 [Trametopsis cervina]|nr:hypothetical protein BDW22DRAFT_801762 [Trametopsis cervina]
MAALSPLTPSSISAAQWRLAGTSASAIVAPADYLSGVIRQPRAAWGFQTELWTMAALTLVFRRNMNKFPIVGSLPPKRRGSLRADHLFLVQPPPFSALREGAALQNCCGRYGSPTCDQSIHEKRLEESAETCANQASLGQAHLPDWSGTWRQPEKFLRRAVVSLRLCLPLTFKASCASAYLAPGC